MEQSVKINDDPTESIYMKIQKCVQKMKSNVTKEKYSIL